jgi:hypothetical protein
LIALPESSRRWPSRDKNIPRDWLPPYRSYFASSFGLDYVEFALERFKKLKKNSMPTRMTGSAQLTYEEAEKKFELHIGNC